ncbi:MAG: hypothetical protein JSU66_17690 [Deltaproteobacteria bacterium]|nr:MAG: hypothetical protein JSU66_17690 [Deltaproteobacteria bacterium]
MQRSKSLPLDLLLLASLVWVLWGLFDPLLAFTDTHIAGGDTISHPWIAKSLKQAWSRGDVWSWNHGWFAGFPMLYFYFYPLYVLVVLLELVGLPEAVAFKVAILCVVTAVPVVYYLTGRRWLSPPQAVLFTALGIGLFFDESQSFWGGNLKSVLSGQASHQIGLLGLVGFLSYVIRGETARWGAVFFYVLAILGHVYTAMFSTLCLGVYAIARLVETRSVARAASCLWMPILCLVMTSFWWLPFLFYRGSTVTPISSTSVNWTEVLNILQVADGRYALIYAGLFACLVANAVKRRLDAFGVGLLAFAALTTASLFFLEGTFFLHARFASAIHLTALFAFLLAFRALDLGRRAQWALAAPLALLVLQSVLPSATLDRRLPAFMRDPVVDSRSWWLWNMSGIERRRNARDVLGVWSFLAGLEDDEGRVAVEYENYNRYGSPRVFELTPYMTGKPVFEGLLLESSVNYPSLYYINFHFNQKTWWPGFPVVVPERDVRQGVEYLARYNIKYFVAGREPTRTDMRALGYPLLYENRSFEIYAVNASSRIASRVEGEIPVLRTPKPLMETVLNFPASLDKIVELEAGDTAVEDALEAIDVGEQQLVPLDGSWSEDGQSYTVFETGAAPGRPQNVLFKISYFPNWQSAGGERVRLVTPNLMLVRTEQPSVTLEYRAGWPERLALLASVAALLAAAATRALTWSSRRGFPRRAVRSSQRRGG